MREISQSLEDAILDKSSSTMLVQARIDPSRTYFEAPSVADVYNDYVVETDSYAEGTDTPVGQCMIYSPYTNKTYTFIVDSVTGVLYGMTEGSDTETSLGISADENTKPGVVDLGGGYARLYYWNDALYRTTVNLSDFSISGTTTIDIDSLSGYWSVIAGSPTAIADDSLVFCYKTSKGGIGVGYWNGSKWDHWRQRFMSPKSLTSTDWTIYTTGTVFKGYLYVYSTDIDSGDVRTVKYSSNRGWSDTFVSVPSDFSRFNVANAKVANGYVHLAGQFQRTGEYEEARTYALVLRSSNGHTFSWDRFSLLSSSGYRFHIDFDNANKKVYASDRNATGSADMSYFFTNAPTNRLWLRPPSSIISFNTSIDGASMTISSANESYIENEVVKKGNRVIVDLGYKTEDKPEGEYIKHGTYIIDGKKTIWQDGKRNLVLSLVSEGIWKTNQIAFPFYAEILSKSSMYDNCDALDKQYVTPCFSAGRVGKPTLEYMTIDFWNSKEWDGDGVVTGGIEYSWCAFPQADISYSTGAKLLKGKTCNLNAHPHMSSYPTITGDMTLSLYGWETGDSAGRAQSTWTIYAITAPEDDLGDKTVTTGVKTSTYQVFPKENYSPSSVGTQAGSYPITFSFSGIEVGHKLLYFGITANNATSGTSNMYLERIEVWSGVKFFYSQYTSSTPWSLDTPTGEDRNYLISPDTGLQNLNFTTKPYGAFNFNISAEFGYSAGAYPLSPGTTAWGVVGLAKDGQDYFCARYNKQKSRIELCLFRNGMWNVLDSWTSATLRQEIMLDHRNGLLSVWYKNGETWTGPVIRHHYDEITNGVMSTSDTGIMHTGVYASVFPPSFLAAGFAQPYSDGICMTTDQRRSALASFPSSGQILLNRIRYGYSGKTTGSQPVYGPYQLRQVTDIGSWTEGGVNYSGVGAEIALYKPENTAYTCSGLLIGQSNYHNWLLTVSDWTVVHSTAGVPDYLRHRSRHKSNRAIHENSYAASISDRVYLNHGLLNPTMLEGQPYMHPNGSRCSIYSTDKIWVKKVVSTQIDHDATVEDMLRFLCHTASVEAEFPGNWTKTSLAISSTPVEICDDKDLFPGGIDVRFVVNLVDGNHVEITTDELKLAETEETLSFGIKRDGTKLIVYIEPSDASDNEYVVTTLDAESAHAYRILVHSDFVSFYGDGITLATLALGEENLEWPEDPLTMHMSSGSNVTVEDIVVSELFDWREAIYIESEMAISSAIGSVIQERPIETFPTEDGALSFSYRFQRDSVEYTQADTHRILRKHEHSEQNSDNAGSDALIYYADVAFVSNSEYAKNDGFNTRVFRLSSLDTGAKLAATLILQKAYEKQRMGIFTMRPDLRLQMGDIAKFTYTVSGTQTQKVAEGIIEKINIAAEEGRHTMVITARDLSEVA